MRRIPLQALPNQTLRVNLALQNVQLDVFQEPRGLFMTVYRDNQYLVTSVICQNGNPIVQEPYLGFIGDFVWIDMLGTQDPYYTGLGRDGRYRLIYLEQGDLA